MHTARRAQGCLDVVEHIARRHVTWRCPLMIDRLDMREVVAPNQPLRPWRLIVDEMRRGEKQRRVTGKTAGMGNGKTDQSLDFFRMSGCRRINSSGASIVPDDDGLLLAEHVDQRDNILPERCDRIVSVRRKSARWISSHVGRNNAITGRSKSVLDYAP